jgi:hypothetical protein
MGLYDFLADAPEGSPESYQGLQSRRKIAEALAIQKRPYATNIGEGIAAMGDSVGNAIRLARMDAQERAYQDALIKAGAAAPIPGTDAAPRRTAENDIPPAPAPVATAAPASTPDTAATAAAFTSPIVAQDDAPISPQAAAAGATQDEVNTGRIKLAQALTDRGMLANQPLGGQPPAAFTPLRPNERVVARPPAGNPTIPTDIPKRPVDGAGGVPGPLAPPVPTPPPPPAPGSLQPQQVPSSKPAAPVLDLRPTPEEIKGIQMLRAHPNDPNYQALAQPWIAYGQQKRQADFAQRQETYKADLATWAKAQELALEQGTPAAQLKLQEAREDAARKQRDYEQFGGLSREEVLSPIKENLANAKNLPAAAMGINNARAALNADPGMFTGSAANVQLSAKKLLAAAGFPADPRIPPTEAFKNYITGVVGSLRSQVVGTGAQSNAELQLLEKAAGSDTTLDRRSMNDILNAVEKLNTLAAIEHQKKVLTFTGDNKNAQRIMFGEYGVPAMEQVVPSVAVNALKQHYAENPGEAVQEFDTHFHTPGLALRILQSGR